MLETQRKQNYIDSHVQGALVKRVICHWLMFFGVLAIATIGLHTLTGDPAIPMHLRLQAQIGDFFFLAVLMLAILPAFILDTVRFSNRFVGPISRLRKGLRELNDLDPKPLAFRNNDFWVGIANEFNRVAKLVVSQQHEIKALRSKLDELTGSTAPQESTAENNIPVRN